MCIEKTVLNMLSFCMYLLLRTRASDILTDGLIVMAPFTVCLQKTDTGFERESAHPLELNTSKPSSCTAANLGLYSCLALRY